MKNLFFITACAFILFPAAGGAADNIFLHGRVIASSEAQGAEASKSVDGLTTRTSTWISADSARPPHTLEVDLERYFDIDSVVIHTGIPDAEKSLHERIQAAGFWSVKNLKLQYWDDANWTDIPGTEVTENRRDRISFHFRPAVTTFRFRLRSVDGEAIRIVEFEGYGRANTTLPAPSAEERNTVTAHNGHDGRIAAKITPEISGTSMKYVGYNQGYFVPGSNVSAWIEYSGTNNVRMWASLNEYVKRGTVREDPSVATLEDFDRHKAALRIDPLGSGYIRWDNIAALAAQVLPSTNTMSLDYALDELQKLDMDVLLQIGSTDFNGKWDNSWKQWQRYYALVFYAARRGNVQMFAMQNEPNHAHSGPMKLDIYIEAMKIVSDAIECAVADVNRIFGRQLTPCFVAPVTAGFNTNWWASIAASERVDYRGEKMDRDLFRIFSTHSYNLPAAGYTSRVPGITEILRENHPEKLAKPVVFTEIGRWMNAYLIDKEETMDSPSLFTEWAGIYTNNMLGGGYGMWAFKFANTASNIYPRGIKSGHHHIWKGKRFVEGAYCNLALGKSVTSSGYDAGYDPCNITDGDKGDASSWRASGSGSKWVEIELGHETAVGAAVVYTGSSYGEFTGPDRIKTIRVEAWDGKRWTTVAGETNIRYTQLIYTLPEAIRTSRIRVTTDDEGRVCIREIKLFGPEAMQAEESYDVSGVQRTAQVVRLFAKGFKDQRPLYTVQRTDNDGDLDICASKDPATGILYIWIVQRNPVDYDLNLDLSSLGVAAGRRAVCETVSETDYGEASLLEVGRGGVLSLKATSRSVRLLTISPESKVTKLRPYMLGSVRGGKFSDTNYRSAPAVVQLDSYDTHLNSVVYTGFDTRKIDFGVVNRALIGVDGMCADKKGPMRLHVYLFPSDEPIDTRELAWNNAPYLDGDEARITGLGQSVWVAGEAAFDGVMSTRSLDITEAVKRHRGRYLNFVFIREVREPGDDYDEGRFVTLESPVLTIY